MRPASPSIDERRSARGPGIGIGIGNVAIAISRARKPSCHDGRAWQPLVPSRTTQRRATQGDGMEDAPGITCRGTRGSLWTVGGLEPLFLRARGMWTQVRARRSLVGVVACFWLLPAAPTARTSWRGWRKRLQLARAKCPARPRTRLTRQARRGQPGDESRTACCRPDPSPSPAPLPCPPPPRPSRKGTRIATSPRRVLKVALVLFLPAGALGLPFAMAARHHHDHSPIPFERCGAWWPPSPPLAKANVTPALSQHTSAAVVVLLSLSPSQQCCARQH